MQNHLNIYLENVSKTTPYAVESIRDTVSEIIPKYVEKFTHKEHIKGLLLGQVQSGKTGQMLGIVAATADIDPGFMTFILLTSDITALQQQTYKRALESMDSFNICDEHDEERFRSVGSRKPQLIIIKKNSNILKKWRDILVTSNICEGRPIFVIDDEADAASLNTLVNKNDQSSINTHLQKLLEISTSSFYLQVTATPQSLLLQSEESDWKPSFVHYFPPGKKYLGGEFFYSKPQPYTNITTEDDELSTLIDTSNIPEGLKLAIETYLITAAHITLNNDSKVCNFLIHPSVKIVDHERIRIKTTNYLNEVFDSLSSESTKLRLRAAWNNLNSTKPDIKSFNDIIEYLNLKPSIFVRTMNSSPESNSGLTYDIGLNIIIGGNSLGRGVTFKSLQTVYYCRSAKTPQADTFWQHCRMFGYDRDPSLMRVFMPLGLYNLFSEINAANEVLIKQIEEGNFNRIQIITSKGVQPTRKNVIDQERYQYLVGGVNYFPPVYDQENVEIFDKILAQFSDNRNDLIDIPIANFIEIVGQIKTDEGNSWSTKAFTNALAAIASQKDFPGIGKIVVRRERDIGMGTGTLLSPTDRKLSGTVNNIPVLIMYRLTGQKEGWKGIPFWVPNIKLPDNKVYHRID